MDPFSLANLPLSALALVAFFWVLVQAVQWASSRIDLGALRTARRSRFRLYLASTAGSLVPTLRNASAELQEISQARSKTGATENTARRNVAIADQVRSFIDWIGGMSQPSGERKETDSEGHLVTPGHLNYAEYSENLHYFSRNLVGAVHYVLENLPVLQNQLKYYNKLRGESGEQEAYTANLLSIQYQLLKLLVMFKAIRDKAFLKRLKARVKKLKGRVTPAKDSVYEIVYEVLLIKELMLLTGREMPEIPSMKCNRYNRVKDVWELQDLTPDLLDRQVEWAQAEEPHFWVDTDAFQIRELEVLNVALPHNHQRYWLFLPATVALIFAAAIWWHEPFREWLYPERGLDCEVTIAADGSTETTCAFHAPDLPQALRRVQAID